MKRTLGKFLLEIGETVERHTFVGVTHITVKLTDPSGYAQLGHIPESLWRELPIAEESLLTPQDWKAIFYDEDGRIIHTKYWEGVSDRLVRYLCKKEMETLGGRCASHVITVQI